MLNKLFKALNKTRNSFSTLIHSLNGKKISVGYGKSKKNAEKDASRVACEILELS